MPKHILFVLDYYKPHRWGVETVFENVISRLLSKWYKVSVLTSRFDDKLKKKETLDNVHIYRTGKGRCSFMFAAIFKGIKILKSQKDISIIHASTYGWAIPASMLGKLFKKRTILTVHEVFGKLRYAYKWKVGWRLYKLFERSIFWFKYDIYHCVSTYTLNSLRTIYSLSDHKLRLIHNGVDTAFWNPELVSPVQIKKWRTTHGRDGKFVLLYYGHTGKSKGIDTLIQAIPDLVKKNPSIKIVFNLIHANRDGEVKAKIQTMWYNKNIQILDGFEAEDLRVLVASCDVVVAPSLSEGFGSVHTESVAMKKPLITTYVASIPEVVSWKVRFVTPGSASEIVDALDDIRSWNIQEIPYKPFSWDKTVEKIEKLYDH